MENKKRILTMLLAFAMVFGFMAENAGFFVKAHASQVDEQEITFTDSVSSAAKTAVTDANGQASVPWKLDDTKPHTITAAFAETQRYSSSLAEINYTQGKESQTFEAEIVTADELRLPVDELTYTQNYYIYIKNIKSATEGLDQTHPVSAEMSFAPNDYIEIGAGELQQDGSYLYPLTPVKGCDTKVEWTVTLEGNDFYNPSSKTISVNKILKKEISLKEVTAQPKTYDGNTTVTVTAKLNLEGILGKDLENAGKVTLTTQGKASGADAGEALPVSDITFNIDKEQIGEDEAASYISERYMLENGGSVSEALTVSIAKKALILTPGDASIDYTMISYAGDMKDVLKYEGGIVPLSVEGFVGDDSVQSVEGFVLPGIMIDESAFISGKVVGRTYPNVLKVIESSGNPTNNYYFDFENQTLGSLTLLAEEASGDYISFSSGEGLCTCQLADGKIYYGVENPVAKFVINENPRESYTKIILEFYDGNGALESIQDVTQTGVSLDSELPSQTLSFHLENADGTLKTTTFSLNLYRDSGKPEVFIRIGEANIALNDFAKAITFGQFSNTVLEANVTVEDPVKEDSPSTGISGWFYCIVDTGKDIAFNSASLTKEQFLEYFKESSLSFSGEITGQTSKIFYIGNVGGEKDGEYAKNNYIVFVLATDNVGNTSLYGSNGIIIENVDVAQINIEYKDTKSSNKEHYFNTDVLLSVDVRENVDDIFSGIAQVDYVVTKDGAESRGTLYKYESESDGDANTPQKPDTTLEDLKENYARIQRELGLSMETGSKEVYVKIIAADFAGNTRETIWHPFWMDPVAPVISNSYTSDAQTMNGKYYNKDVVLTTAITERFLDIYNDVRYTLEIDGRKETVTLGQLMENKGAYGVSAVEVIDETDAEKRDDQTVSTIKVTFHEEHNYIIGVSVQDKAGNRASASNYEFVVDQTAPVIKTQYFSYGSGEEFTPSGEAGKPYYLGEAYHSFTVRITVEELNFSQEDAVAAQLTVGARDAKDQGLYTELTADLMSQIKTDSAGVWHTADQTHVWEYTFKEDANYEFVFSYMDLAGNKAEVAPAYVTLDTTKPKGTITAGGLVNGVEGNGTTTQMSWADRFLNVISFNLFGKDRLSVTMTSDDAVAGVQTTEYMASSTLFTRQELAGQKADVWKAYTGKLDLKPDQNVIVYAKVTDKAGNIEYYSTANLIVDQTVPAPEVMITPSLPAWGKGVCAASDQPGFDIAVKDPVVNGAYSGLKTISCQIVNTTTGYVEERVLADFERNAHKDSWSGHVTIDPEKFYSNDVRVTVTASDWSANQATSETKTLKIDPKAPIVRFSFDTSDALNGKYYRNTKTLAITVDERNFDISYTPTVTSTAGSYAFSGWFSNGEIHTGVITFSKDGDYTVTFDCHDLAGNKSNTERQEEFTVDQTAPVVNVSYDNNAVSGGRYYKDARTATITITEHNFRAGDISMKTTASLNGASIQAPSVSGWSTSGDRHTATITYGKDGDFTFDITYSDLAGNPMADYAQDSFTVDLTDPEVEITGVQNKSANKGVVAPVLRISDTNFNADNVTLTLTGANKGKVSVDGLVSKASIANGQTISFRNFARDMDDIYTLTAKTVDRAGNEMSKSITFSVNRNGSTYIISEATQKLLDTGFTNAPQDIVISEVNVDTLEFIELTYSKDGQVVELSEGTDYTVEEEGGNGQWKKYTYTIKASCFNEEGQYAINIYSEDRAKNTTTNKVKEKAIEFILDKTPPTVSIANLENRGRYRANVHDFTLSVKDNTVLSYVELYLDGKLAHTYYADELEIVDGQLTITVDSKNDFQTVRLIAYDAAGNPTEPLEYEVLVTSNWWIQFVANKPLFFGCLAAVAVIAAGTIFSVVKRRKSIND